MNHFQTRKLARRELETAMLVAEGLRDSEIAERMGVHVRTVNKSVVCARRKLGLRNRVELAVFMVTRRGELK